MEAEEGKSKSDSEIIQGEEEEEESEDRLLREMVEIAGGTEYLGTLDSVEIIFTHIENLGALKSCHNLIELSLIQTQTQSLNGIEIQGHSLEILRVVGCNLKYIEPVFLKLENL